MNGEEATLAVIDALDAQGVPYMVVGSFSTNHYGIPRSTRDADFVVDPESLSLGRLSRDLGPSFLIDRQLSFETVTGTLNSVEDVIITKLRWSLLANRSKDRDDARDVIAVQGDRIDWDYVHPWCDLHGTRALLDEVRLSIPPI